MKYTKKIIVFSSLLLFVAALTTIVSCSNVNSNENNGYSDEYKWIKNYTENKKKKMFVSKSVENKSLLNISEIKNNGDLEQFKTDIEKYILFEQEFNNFVTKDNNKIFREIKQVNLQPIVNSKDVNVILFLNSSKNDKNVIFERVIEFFQSPFAYQKEFLIKPKEFSNIGVLMSKNDFDSEFKELTVNKNLNLLERAFELSNKDDISNNFNSFNFTIYNYYYLSIDLKHDALNKGFIIKTLNEPSSENLNSYWVNVKSVQIAKEK